MDKLSKRRPAKDTLSSKENMETELNRKLPDPNSSVPVQHTPLTQGSSLPVTEDTPVVDRPSNNEAQSGFYTDEGYNYGDRYGGFQATRFNSSHVEAEEADARADFRYHRYHQPPAHQYVDAYSAPFTDPSTRSRGLRVSHSEPQRESQAPPAFNRMERMERQQVNASSASSQQLQAFIDQGEFSFLSLNCLKTFDRFVFGCSTGFVESLTHGPPLWKEVGRLPVCLRPALYCVSGFALSLGLVASKCVILNIV
jgi:hypothetical protein